MRLRIRNNQARYLKMAEPDANHLRNAWFIDIIHRYLKRMLIKEMGDGSNERFRDVPGAVRAER